MPYEPKMNIDYDRGSKTVTVHFRGEKTVLRGPYATREAGKKAGEDFCRRQGWTG
jgi:hypothetical protein